MKMLKKLLIVLLVSVLLAQNCLAIPSLTLDNYTDTPQMNYLQLRELEDMIKSYHLMSGLNDTPMENAYKLMTGLDDSEIDPLQLRDELLKLLEDPDFFILFANLMLRQYDVYSCLLRQEDYFTAFGSVNAYAGYGFRLAEFGPFFIVTQVYKNSGAEKGGLRAGDIIINANTADVRFAEFDALDGIISRSVKNGGKLTLTCFREDDPKLRTMTLEASIIAVPDVEVKILENNTAVLTISGFRSKSFEYELLRGMVEIINSNTEKVIIDLRGNPGGYITNCLKAINLFVKEKDLLLMSEDTRQTSSSHYSSGNGVSFEKVYILIDGGSASSSEIMAASLCDTIGAVLVGTDSYGKCYGQTTLPFGKNFFLVLTTSEAVLPKTPNYHGKGLKPDEYVEQIPGNMVLPDMLDLDTDKKITPKSSKEQITALEERLYFLKMLESEPDGVYDDETIRAVNCLQTQMGFLRTSNCSVQLLRALEVALEELSTAWNHHDAQLEYVISLAIKKEAAFAAS